MFKKTVSAIALSAAAFLAAPSANAAAVLTPVEIETISWTSTNFFNAPMVFDKFDSSLGTLLEVRLSLTGSVSGTARYESQDAAPTTVTLQLTAQIDLTRPGGASIVQTLPVANVVANPTAFDGTTDFGGTSGGTFSGLSATASNNATLTSAPDLALFTAAFLGETISLELDGLGVSNGSGAGNLILQFITNAGATASVQYLYDNGIQIPEPMTLAVFGLGLVGPGSIRRRKA